MDLVDQAAPVRRGEEIDGVAIDQFLATAVPHISGPLQVKQFPGGFSNLTYLLEKGDEKLEQPCFGRSECHYRKEE